MTGTVEPAVQAPPPDRDATLLRRLRLMQWTLRAALGVALAVSMAANVLHAAPDPVARSIAAWSPLALYAAIEVMTRVPIRHRLLGGIRIVATVAIAVIAGVTSYLHMVGVAERYGESWQVVYLLPISVDGLVAVLTLSLLDIASQVRTISAESPTAPTQQRIGGPFAGAMTDAGDQRSATQAPGDADASRTAAASRDRPLPKGRPSGRSRAADRYGQPDQSRAVVTPTRDGPASLPPDLQPLLEPAAHAYQQLRATGNPITRDTFAAALRDNGQPLRSTKVTPLLTAVREHFEHIDPHAQDDLRGDPSTS
ncbi:DUF2637 domain-containing protein [Dactylosporangium sp. NPDC005555]|uniref:DUF2637 domain-containing protein n=1 Tax=Dactylosporangium sp. NPDC005555 TaxID=3154889 RepID=UPI0033A55ECD